METFEQFKWAIYQDKDHTWTEKADVIWMMAEIKIQPQAFRLEGWKWLLS